MTFEFRPAVREQVSLLLGFSGASGSGKTYSALRVATGLIGPGEKFALIDTEAKRALHYADDFNFDHTDMKPPFSPGRYTDAIKSADEAGYPVIVIDSATHEWSGEGGVLDMQEAELQRMAGDDWKKRESCKMAAWIKPKQQHKRFVSRLLQCRAHLIFCLRAEEKIKLTKVDGKMVPVPQGYMPICAKDFMFEMTASFLLLPDNPGIPQPIKLQDQHKSAFPQGQEVSEASGKAIAEWAHGGSAPAQSKSQTPTSPYVIQKSNELVQCEDISEWRQKMLSAADAINPDNIQAFLDLNDKIIRDLEDDHPDVVIEVRDAFNEKISIPA